MEQSPVGDISLFSVLSVLSVLLLSLVFFLIYRLSSSSSAARTLPPGPKPWPFIGNIFLVGKQPHISMAHLAQLHGELISLRLGTQLLIVGSSPAAAAAILKTHDSLFSARHVPRVVPYRHSARLTASIIWASDCNEKWRFLRSLCQAELFSTKAIESQSILREEKVNEMVRFLESKKGEVVNIGEVVFATVFNTLTNLLFSKDMFGLDSLEGEGGGAGEVKGIIWRLMELAVEPNVSDLFPCLAWLDLQGLKREAIKALQQLFDKWESLIKERRESFGIEDGRPKRDFLDVFIANGLTDDQINILAFELLAAGTDTITTTIEWAMAELLRNKEAWETVGEELKGSLNSTLIKETDITQLPFLQACVKETFRLHPPAPFLLPHRAPENCRVMNYTIPKDAEVLVNVWAIGRDPKIWEEPLAFKPDRFLGLDLDFKGRNFELLPFGSGRRVCPGIPLASKLLPLVLVSLIHSFDWSLPNDEDPTGLDMNEKFGITLEKEQPLLLIPKLKPLLN